MLIAAALEQVVRDNYAAAQASERQVDRGRAGQVIRDGDTRTVARASATYLDRLNARAVDSTRCPRAQCHALVVCRAF